MLKAGTQTGSLMNHLYSRAVNGQPEPEVGMGATLLLWTDRHAATIVGIERKSGGPLIITVREDHAQRTDKNGFSEDQSYDYSPNPNGATYYFRQTAEGFWQQVRKNQETGRWNKVDGCGLQIGVRRHYWDPCF